MFTLTATAAEQIRQAARESDAEQLALRVAARREPDGSIGYGMGFDDVADNDTRLMLEDVAVVIAAAHADLLEDTVLDFVELEPGQFNFIFVSQQLVAQAPAASGCSTGGGGGGCGSGGCGTGGGCGPGSRYL
jgi:iron-sulfur cluster assembly protein